MGTQAWDASVLCIKDETVKTTIITFIKYHLPPKNHGSCEAGRCGLRERKEPVWGRGRSRRLSQGLTQTQAQGGAGGRALFSKAKSENTGYHLACFGLGDSGLTS